jgi:nitrogen regulatory protein P-II 1
VEPAIEAIIKAARTGKIGDGKIFVSSVEQVVRLAVGKLVGLSPGPFPKERGD